MSSLFPQVIIEAELAGHGAGWTDLVAAKDVQKDAGLTVRRGINGYTPQDRVASTGTCNFALRNSTLNSGGLLGYYSPFNANKRSGFGLGIWCRVRMIDPATSTSWTQFVGRIDAIEPDAGKYGKRTVPVSVVDWLDEANLFTLNAAIGEQTNKTWDEIMTAITAQMSVMPVASSFDVGTEPYPYALDTSAIGQQTAYGEAKKLADSEFGFIYVKGDGTLRLEGRHSRMTNAVSVWTLHDTDFQELSSPATRDDVINTVYVTTHPKVVDATPTTIVFNQANPISVPAGTTVSVTGSFKNPNTGDPIGATQLQNLIAGSDWLANARSDGTGADLTANLSIVVTKGASGATYAITNGGVTDAFITKLQQRGAGVKDWGTVQSVSIDATSVSQYGQRVATFDMPYQASVDVGQGAADYIVSKYKAPQGMAPQIKVVGKTPTLLTQILTRDISDRITVNETVTGLSTDFFINEIQLTVDSNGYLTAVYTLAPATDPFASTYWILGTSTLGVDTRPAPF